MKKRVICMLMALSMIFMLLPIGALAEKIHVATCSIEDTVLSNNHRVIPMFGGGSECRFNYDVPEGGKTMLIFYSSTCGNSKYFLNGLSSSPLINDSNLNIVAVESNSTDEDTARNTVEELLGDEKDNIDFYYGNDNVQWDYASLVMDRNDGYLSLSWPFVLIIENVNGRNMIKNYGIGITDIELFEEAIYNGKIPQGDSRYAVVSVPGVESYDYSAEIAELVNADRAAEGLPPVKLDAGLTEYAMQRAAECALFYSHTRPNGKECFSVVDEDDYLKHLGENIAAGYTSPEGVETDWMNSAGHRANILDSSFNYVGIGCFYNGGVWYWVQLFSYSTSAEKAVPTGSKQTVFQVETLRENLDLSYEADADLAGTLNMEIGDKINFSMSNPNYGTNFLTARLLPFVSEVRDSHSGKIIANAEVSWNNSTAVMTVTACANGAGELVIAGYDGDEDKISVHIIVNGEHNHNYEAVTVLPTCTEKGYTTHTCTCGDSYKDNYVEALGHKTEVKNAKDATCTAEGYTGDKVCTVCNTVVEQGKTIAALGHNYKDGVCTVCGAKDPNYKPPEPDHTHDYIATVSAPTCTEKGFTTYTCTCGDSYKDNYVEALGHNYADGVCTVCGAKDPNYKPPVKENPFVDVYEGSVYYDAILWAYYNEPQQITGGYTATEFRPGNPCTRGQVVTFLWRAAGCPEPTGNINVFKDASSIAAPYQKAVAWAVEKGITTGFTDGTFRPNDSVTRAQFVTFLWRYEGKPATSGSIAGFKDAASISGPYQQAVAWAVEKGITTGYNDGSFRPNATCTRWAVVLFMYRDMA